MRAPSLYEHIDSLDALQRGVGLQAVRDLCAVLTRAAVGRSGPDAVRAIAETYRKWALDHPGRYAAAPRAPRPEVGLESDNAFQMERDPADSYRFLVYTLINGMRAKAATGPPDTAPLHAGEGS